MLMSVVRCGKMKNHISTFYTYNYNHIWNTMKFNINNYYLTDYNGRSVVEIHHLQTES